MTKLSKILTVFLIAQLLIVTIIWVNKDKDVQPARQLVTLQRETVSSFTITDEVQVKLQLTKPEADWQLQSGLPADSNKVNRLLTKIINTKVRWPVATSDSAASRFEVEGDNYQRLVELTSAEQSLRLYFGTSPGFRQSHVRVAEEEDIYAIEFENYELSSDPNDWLDKSLLQPVGELKSVEKTGSWMLRANDDGWRLENQGELQATDTQAVNDLLNRLTSLRVDKLVDELGEVVYELGLIDSDGEYTLVVGKLPEDKYQIRSSRRDDVFALPAYIAEALNLEPTAFLDQTKEVRPVES